MYGAAGALCALALWTVWGNTALEVERFTILSPKLPQAFDGFRIVQVSDLHDAAYGKDNQRLLTLLESEKPDLIVLTGDILDSAKSDMKAGERFLHRAAQIAPCYYVTGNHEARVLANQPEVYRAWVRAVKAAGVRQLRDEALPLEKNGGQIWLIGLNDPGFLAGYPEIDTQTAAGERLTGLIQPDAFQILLAHRPEHFAVYCKAGIDLAFAGHAHGGQWRIPGVGGLAAPDQGLFPTYDAGLFTKGDTNMIVSRGLDNTRIVPRVFNRPEIVAVQLRYQTDEGGEP